MSSFNIEISKCTFTGQKDLYKLRILFFLIHHPFDWMLNFLKIDEAHILFDGNTFKKMKFNRKYSFDKFVVDGIGKNGNISIDNP